MVMVDAASFVARFRAVASAMTFHDDEAVGVIVRVAEEGEHGSPEKTGRQASTETLQGNIYEPVPYAPRTWAPRPLQVSLL